MSERNPAAADRYLVPNRSVSLMNRVVMWLTRRGTGPAGCHVLAVRGRTSGEVRTTPVNVLEVDGERYLMSPRGNTQWVRNLRAAGVADLRRGRKSWTSSAVELGDEAKPDLLREYLRNWNSQVSTFVDGLTPDSPRADFEAAAPGFPVFRLG